MTPEEAVAQLAKILAARPEFTENDVYDAMADAGVPGPIADCAYKFTQIACGRVFLDGLGITFDPDYLCFDGDGEVIESGKLLENPYYRAARAMAKRKPAPDGLPRLALMSAECRAVNHMLNNGSEAKDIATSIAALFMAKPTDAGMAKARRILNERLVSSPGPKNHANS